MWASRRTQSGVPGEVLNPWEGQVIRTPHHGHTAPNPGRRNME